MRLVRTEIEREYRGPFERHQAWFQSRNGRELRFLFVVPHAYRHWLSDRADHWLVLGATSAAIFGESYSQDIPAPRVLKRNLDCLIRQWAEWYPGARCIEIDVPVLDETGGKDDASASHRGLFYTGGVDSTFTLSSEDERTDILIKAIFDWDDETHLVDQLANEPKFAHGKPVLPVGTNVLRAFPEFADAWAYRTHGPALGSIAHLLSGGLEHVTFSSSQTYGKLIPWGSHPLTDPLLSSHELQFHHFGTQFSRLEKIQHLAGDPALLAGLDVCGQEPGVKGRRVNCSRCKKCLRTMMALDLSGVAPEDAPSFDWSQYSARAIARIRLHNPNEFPVFHELLEDALANDRQESVEALRTILRKSYVYRPLGAFETFLRRRFPSQVVNRPILKSAKHRFFHVRERWT
ncbi:hypothetical protein [Qipengyuania oceanensis]|uniref:Uncharacterized protein n=1 Tax=Qipengyuania oceanensis TaxID=1463597 RepID=A0A844YHM8_9SPHN|nr:hypothetical protein [Qipengyuania oceanensis]MXO62528.1 hypothetical protein [Qipengyuania oceanensis]